jgi:hypothetical protein
MAPQNPNVPYPTPGIPIIAPVTELGAPRPNVQNSSIMTAKDLKDRFLYGIHLTSPTGQVMSDDAIQYHIDAATSAVENYLQINVRPRYYPEERADYQRSDYTNWGYFRLKNSPIIQIFSFQIIYPDTGSVVNLPLQWLQMDMAGENGVVNIIPGVNSASSFIIGYGNSILPLVFSTADFLPDLFKISYTAGFPANKVPEIFTSVIGKKAVIDILIQISNSYLQAGAIEQQIGVDGNFERTTTIPFIYEKQIELYRKQYAEEISQLRSRYAGIKMVVA